MALEKAGAFHGVYHVLLGRLAPLSGSGPEQLTIDALVARVRAGTIRELIMATNPNLEGDGTALLIANRLERMPRYESRGSLAAWLPAARLNSPTATCSATHLPAASLFRVLSNATSCPCPQLWHNSC